MGTQGYACLTEAKAGIVGIHGGGGAGLGDAGVGWGQQRRGVGAGGGCVLVADDVSR
jgi:hypothetical protein